MVLVRVLATVDGVSGQVPAVQVVTTGVYLSYEVGGVAAPEQRGYTIFEPSRPLAEASPAVVAGDHTSGYVYFASGDTSGQVIAAMSGVLDPKPLAVWQG